MELEFESSEDEDIIFVPKTAQTEDKTGDEMPAKQEKAKKTKKVEKKEPTKAVSTSYLILLFIQV